MRAVGVTPAAIIFSYMFISLFYVLIGVVFGGILLSLIVWYFNIYPIQFYETISISPSVTFDMIIQSVLSLIAISLVSGFIPAWFVTKQKMIDAIWGAG